MGTILQNKLGSEKNEIKMFLFQAESCVRVSVVYTSEMYMMRGGDFYRGYETMSDTITLNYNNALEVRNLTIDIEKH